MLELDELDVRYGSVPAVRGLNLAVERGELVGLIGPNGAGKSTTLHAIMGVVPAAAGDVRLAGRSIRGRAPEAIARAGIALVPEGRRIFGELTVEENLRLGLAARRARRRRRRIRSSEAFELFPMLAEFRAPPGGRSLRRPAAAARDRARARRRPGRAPARRALARALADRRRRGLRRARARSASAASPSSSSSSARSARSRSPTARYVLANGELRMTLTPADADDTEKMIRGVPRMIVARALDAQTLVDAVGLGAVYALMAVGIGLVFGVLRLVNFAYGQLDHGRRLHARVHVGLAGRRRASPPASRS